MREYSVQVGVTDGIVTFTVRAESPEKALEYGRQKLKKTGLFADDVEVIDYAAEITVVY